VNTLVNRAGVLAAKFKERFGAACGVYRSPGRVNLIGEHTDYNDGFVLPAAIDFSCWVGCAPRDDRALVVHSENLGETVEGDLDALRPGSTGKWADYPFGVAWALEQAGHRLKGANLFIASEVPLGAGLSSSAAIEVSVGYALLDTAEQPVKLTELARLCQRAENEYVGARCGIMDQLVACHGRAGHALLLDCRSLEYQLFRIPEGLQLVICNTMVQHEIGASEYNVRRAQCEEGVRRLAEVMPGIRALRDVPLEELERHRSRLGEIIYKRCRHVITENKRVLEAAQILRTGNIESLSSLLAESHRSMRDDYEISCPEIEVMVDIASGQKGVYGARMTGGGFGGCTINLVATEDCSEFKRRVAAQYESRTGLKPEIYICEASDGAKKVWPEGRELANEADTSELLSSSEFQDVPHRRFNPLTKEWVLVSPQRTKRPWQGRVEKRTEESEPKYDPSCYLCPGNERAGGARNPNYESTFVFDNDYAALLADAPKAAMDEAGLFVARSETGICRVVCFSPRHDLRISRMPVAEVRKIVDVWAEQFQALEKTGWIRSVLIFENSGFLIGTSNPHPHCQIWANAQLPNVPEKELRSFREYREKKASCLLCDYLNLEMQKKERVVCENKVFALIVPFWAVWPFETMVLSKRHIAAMDELSSHERDGLADILRRATIRYDNLFETAFPYSMGFHQRPTDGELHPEWHFHAHYLPPLLRSATVQKFMVGYELLGSPQRDIAPEEAAARLRDAGETHYLDRAS
jgi:UDPglucose--hexose-1-phosphate uridylyltransferase